MTSIPSGATTGQNWDSSFTIRKALLVALMGCGISVLIEALQFFFMRGFSEVDDVMHNTLGCLIGWFLVKGLRFMVKGYNKNHG